MNPRIRQQPRAALDLVDQAAWYIKNAGPPVADRFLEAAERTAEALLVTPGMGLIRTFRDPRLTGLRVFPVKGFPKHLIFYRQVGDGIELVRVLHGARDVAAVLAEEG
jgi:toxin ParE1/3/4